MRPDARRPGFTLIELVAGLVVVGLVVLYLMLALPRGRESSRRLTCQRNLAQIGLALGLYSQSAGLLPVARIGGDGPLAALLDDLGQPDFLDLRDRKERPPRKAGIGPSERPVRGFVCPSDTGATSGTFAAPISYRANTGDTPDGRGGPFDLGRAVRVAEVESGDGLAFTAAFSERLVGSAPPAPYGLVPGPIGPHGCPAFGPSDRRQDAGSSWRWADWRSTLYFHGPTPNVTTSCVAADGLRGFMGASSVHGNGTNVLLLDGSLRTFRSSVEPGVWRSLGRFEGGER